MSSKALLIRDAIIAKLTTPALTAVGSGGVSVDPDYAFETRELPVVAVYMGDESVERSLISAEDRVLTITARIISKGSDAFATADALLIEAHARIVSDPTLGGLAMDVRNVGIRRSRDVLEVPVAVTELDFAVDYRTTMTSLET